MINIINLRQLYKHQKITKKKIYRYYNPTKFITKTKLLSALKTLIDKIYINISITKWVKWAIIK